MEIILVILIPIVLILGYNFYWHIRRRIAQRYLKMLKDKERRINELELKNKTKET
jgi:hypothetical protein